MKAFTSTSRTPRAVDPAQIQSLCGQRQYEENLTRSYGSGGVRMNAQSSLRQACDNLFANYPLAARSVSCDGIIRSMILMLRDGDMTRFYVVSHNCSEGRSFYSMSSWPTGRIADTEACDIGTVSDEVMNVVTDGVPIPRHGSLFGWTYEDTITTLIVIYAEYEPPCMEPSWTVMPLAGLTEAQWPPFTGEHLFGHWFWRHYRAGRIVTLSDVIAETPETIFWVDTTATIGSACCAVANDIRIPKGPTLRHGRYVYHQALRADKPVAPLKTLLADASRIDLAPRFR